MNVVLVGILDIQLYKAEIELHQRSQMRVKVYNKQLIHGT